MKAFFKTIVVKILSAEARFLLWRKKPTIIAITGSVGKTSTKDAVYAAIKDKVSARKSQKSFNSEIGVPLTVLGLQNGWSNPFLWLWNVVDGFFVALFTSNYPEVLVLETGVDAPGDMAILTKWLRPDVVVLTRLPDVPVHVEYFSTPEAVVVEKMQLVKALKPDGVLVCNNDDPVIVKQLESVRQKIVTFARYQPADVSVSDDEIYYMSDAPLGVTFSITSGGATESLKFENVLGPQFHYAAAAAVAVAKQVGIAMPEATTGLSQLLMPPGRMYLLPGLKNSLLIDDSYNSSPTALEHALDTMAQVRHKGRRIAVLGDMLELGKFSTSEHERLGEKVGRTCDALLTVGVRARGFATGALSSGLDDSVVWQYETAERAGSELQNLLQPGDLVLIKGSQGIRTEKIVKEVMNEPQRAEELLVRQDSAWQQR